MKKTYPPCAWPECESTTGDYRSRYCKVHRIAIRRLRSKNHYLKTQIAQGKYPRMCKRCGQRPAARSYCPECREPHRAEYRKRREQMINLAVEGDVKEILKYVSVEIDRMRLGVSFVNAKRLEHLAKVLTSIRIDHIKRTKRSEIYQRLTNNGKPAKPAQTE